MSKWSSGFRDSRWQKKRLAIMNRDKWVCCSCGAGEGTMLSVHHTYYEKGRAPWEFEDESLVTLCQNCHNLLSAAIKEIAYKISFVPNINESIEGLKNLVLFLLENTPVTDFFDGFSDEMTEEETVEFIKEVENAAETARAKVVARWQAFTNRKRGAQ